MKKILFLHSGAELYGADQILLATVSEINKNEFEPIVVLPNNGPLVDLLKKNNIRVEIIPYPIIRRKYFNVKGILMYSKEYFKACKKLKKLINDEKIEYVHNNTIAVLEGTYLKKHCNIKLISHVHEMIESPKIVAKYLYKIHLKYCDKMVVVSNAVRNYIESFGLKNTNKICVIHNGIKSMDYNEKYRNVFLKEYGIPDNAFVVAIVGRINAIKGQDHFIKAMHQVIKKNSDAYGVIIGDAFKGQEWRIEELKKSIEKEKNIIYCGFRNDINHLYSAFDLLVVSSVQKDSFPTVVLEAMSCGVPCVAYKCGGVEEMIVNNKNGYLVDQGNIDELSRRIQDMVINKEKNKSFKNNCVAIFNDNYTTHQYIKNIEKIYE